MSYAPEVHCVVTIRGNRAVIRGTYPLDLVKKITSYPVQGARFSAAYKAKRWDGRKHLFHEQTASMPAGLAESVIDALRRYNSRGHVQLIDQREDSAPPIAGHSFELETIDFGQGVYDYQLEAAKTMLQKKRGILKIATNGGKSSIAAAVIKHLAVPSVFVVPGLELLYQTQQMFSEYLAVPLDSIGLVGDGHCEIKNWITISTIDSLYSRLLDSPDFLASAKKWGALFLDECHTAGSDTAFAAANMLPAYYRFGLSGTPLYRTDGADLRLISQTGEVIYEVTNKELVTRGISVQPHVELLRVDQPSIATSAVWGTAHKEGIVENQQRNHLICEKVRQFCGQGMGVVVMVEKIKHGKILSNLLSPDSVPFQFINGQETTEVRQCALKDFSEGVLQCLIATSILDQGVDTPAIDCLIFAGGGKARIRTLQRAGRGLRRGANKDKLIIVDFADLTHRYLTKHSLQRLETYKAEDCFVLSTGT